MYHLDVFIPESTKRTTKCLMENDRRVLYEEEYLFFEHTCIPNEKNLCNFTKAKINHEFINEVHHTRV